MPDRIRVLHVADEPGALELTETADSTGQFEVRTATTALDALDRLADRETDCIVSAYRLPGQDGLKFLEAVRERYSDLPFVLRTDDGSEAVASEAISRGVTDYLRPSAESETDQTDLADRIVTAVSAYRTQQRYQADSNLLDEIFDQVPVHLFVKDTDGRHRRVSTHLMDRISHEDEDLLVDSFTRDEIIGKTDVEIADGKHEGEAYADDKRVVETGEPVINKEEYSPFADEWNLTSKVPWYGEDGSVQGIIGVSHRITERKRYQQELERQNERLDEFTSIVSHDLRNPLNVAQGHLERARTDGDGEALDIVADSHDRMETLVENLLTIAREGEAVTEFAAVPLTDLVESCWRTVATGDATLVVETDAVVRADQQRVKQVVENLLRNAVEHGDDAVEITVGTVDGADEAATATTHEQRGGFAVGFYVADDGPGISRENRERVLERGYSTTPDGTGFGLSIVAQIANAHGWTVTVTESADGGARFEFTDVKFAATDVESPSSRAGRTD